MDLDNILALEEGLGGETQDLGIKGTQNEQLVEGSQNWPGMMLVRGYIYIRLVCIDQN
jgi:hypothetical protein